MTEKVPEEQPSGPGTFGVETAADFFHKIVRPTVEEYRANLASERHALLAVLVCYHLVEWHRPTVKWSDKRPFVKKFEEAYGEAREVDYFDTARKLTNGTKHFRGPSRTRGTRGFGPGFSDEFARLVVELPDRKSISVRDLLRRMMHFWETRLSAMEAGKETASDRNGTGK